MLGTVPGKGRPGSSRVPGGMSLVGVGCCVDRAGALPGRLEPDPEQSRSRGGQSAPAAAAVASHRSVTLETPSSPRGPEGWRRPAQPSQPDSGHGRSQPGPIGSGQESCLRPRPEVWGARQSPPLSPFPVSRCSAAANHRPCCQSAVAMHPHPHPAFRIRHSQKRQAGGGEGLGVWSRGGDMSWL